MDNWNHSPKYWCLWYCTVNFGFGVVLYFKLLIEYVRYYKFCLKTLIALRAPKKRNRRDLILPYKYVGCIAKRTKYPFCIPNLFWMVFWVFSCQMANTPSLIDPITWFKSLVTRHSTLFINAILLFCWAVDGSARISLIKWQGFSIVYCNFSELFCEKRVNCFSV